VTTSYKLLINFNHSLVTQVYVSELTDGPSHGVQAGLFDMALKT